MEAQRKLRHGWLWGAFLLFMLCGAALVMAGGDIQVYGFVLIGLAIVLPAGLTFAFYLVQRQRAPPKRPPLQTPPGSRPPR